MTSLNGKVACITGGTGGIGKALALALAQEGCDLILAARTESELKKIAERVRESTQQKVLYCAVDISDVKQFDLLSKTVQEVGRLDILINGAAIFSDETLESIESQDLMKVVDTITRGTMLVSKTLLPYLKESQGHIVNLITDWAVPGWTGPAPFSASKWAVAGMGEALATELIGYGVKVTNIFPGDVASDMDPECSIQDVYDEHGNSMIPLADLVSTILHVLKLKMSRIQSLVILPVDPEYVG